MLEYYHADRLNYAVARTPQRLEYDQGFFVKLGDGAADVKPIAGLYKTQVYALARHLRRHRGDPDAPAHDGHLQPLAVAGRLLLSPCPTRASTCSSGRKTTRGAGGGRPELGLTPDQVRRVYDDIDQKRRATAYLHAPPVLLEPVDELPALARR